MSKKNKPKRVKIIANPGAGGVIESSSVIEETRQYLTQAGMEVDVALAKPKKAARKIARQAVEDGFDILVSMGGDGTIGMVMRGMIRSKAQLGIIASGTENDIAKALGIPEDVKGACDVIASGHVRSIDLGRVSTKQRKKMYFPMLTAVGIISTVYPMIKEVPEGKLSGIKDGIITFLNYEPKPTVYLTLDGESKLEFQSMLVTVTNTPIIGLQNMIAPDASMEDGLLDVAIYPEFSKAQLLSYFARTSREKIVPDGTIQRYRARKIKIKTSPKLDIAAEGILIGKGTARIKAIKGALQVFAPPVGSGIEKPPEDTAPQKSKIVSPKVEK